MWGTFVTVFPSSNIGGHVAPVSYTPIGVDPMFGSADSEHPRQANYSREIIFEEFQTM